MKDSFSKISSSLVKSAELGVAAGWAIICTEDGKPYFDLQGDHITEEAMLEAAVEFMEKSQVMGAGHEKLGVGQSWVFPVTTGIAKLLGIETKRTGLLVMAKPDDETLKAIDAGEYTGFSIGGTVTALEYQDEAA